jgi:hypothetical protein
MSEDSILLEVRAPRGKHSLGRLAMTFGRWWPRYESRMRAATGRSCGLPPAGRPCRVDHLCQRPLYAVGHAGQPQPDLRRPLDRQLRGRVLHLPCLRLRLPPTHPPHSCCLPRLLPHLRHGELLAQRPGRTGRTVGLVVEQRSARPARGRAVQCELFGAGVCAGLAKADQVPENAGGGGELHGREWARHVHVPAEESPATRHLFTWFASAE